MLSSSSLPLLALALFLPAAKPEPAAPLVPRATIGHYNGNLGINTAQWSLVNGDIPAAVVAGAPPAPTVFGPTISVGADAKAVGGQNWGPVLDVGTCPATPTIGVVYIRTSVVNGPNKTIGACTSEILMSGPLLGTITLAISGTTLGVPPQPVPLTAIGTFWVSQALLRGGTGSGLSSAIYGTVDACF